MKTFDQVLKDIEENKKNLEFLPTGFEKLDTFLDGGFLRKELVVLGAPTGKGKSLIAGNIFYNIVKKGFLSAYFSLEISNEMIVSRLLGSESGIKPTRVMVGTTTEEEYASLIEAKASLGVYNNLMSFYDDIYLLNELEKHIKDNKYDFVVIDFIQNIMTQKSDEYERLSHVALSLQKLAKDANCCILVLSQLSNLVAREKRDDVVEYRGSGSIATVCDLGFFIEQAMTSQDEVSFDRFNIRLRKNRRGISGMAFEYKFDFWSGRITEL